MSRKRIFAVVVNILNKGCLRIVDFWSSKTNEHTRICHALTHLFREKNCKDAAHDDDYLDDEQAAVAVL